MPAWPKATVASPRRILLRGGLRLVAGLLVLCWQDHPVLDELKSFSGLDAPLPEYLLLGTLFLLGLAFVVHHYAVSFRRAADDIDSISISSSQKTRSGQTVGLLESLVSLCIGCSSAMVSVLVSIPAKVLPVSMVGAMALAEYYHRASWTATNKVLLVVIAAVSLAIVAASFTHSTVYYLVYSFAWHFDLSMQQFCSLFALLLAFAVAVPALLMPVSSTASSRDSLGLPGSGVEREGAAGVVRKVLRRAFIVSAVALTYVYSAAELMMREQDWSSLEVTVETIYPTYYLLGTAALVLCAAVGLYAAEVIGPSSLWVLAAVQGCKLLHLAGLPSKACFAVGALLLTYTLPFVRHINEYLVSSAKAESGSVHDGGSALEANGLAKDTTLHVAEVLCYALSATAVTFWARSHVAYSAVCLLLGNDDPSDLQVNAASLAAWSLYMACLLLVFFRKVKALRRCDNIFFFKNCHLLSFVNSLLLVVCVLSTLVATEGLGKLSFAVDPSSALFLTVSLHPDLAVNEHTGLFILLSGGLTFAAFVGLIPLQHPLASLLYSLVYGFIAAKATLGWAFPLSLGGDELLSHDLLAFPFAFVFAAKVVNTFVALRHHDGSLVVDALFAVACLMPFAAVVFTVLTGCYDNAIAGVVWSSLIGMGSLCVSVRSRDFAKDIRAISKQRPAKTGSHVAMLICVVCAVLGMFWASVAVAIDSTLDRDLLVPLSTLLMLTTKRGTLMPDTHPVAVVAVLCATWWVLSAGHAMFVRGFREEVLAQGGAFQFQQHSVLGLDQNVSLWTSSFSLWMHGIHLTLLLLPLPGIALSFLRRKDDSDQALFALSLLSIVSLVGGPVGSIRYLGLLGCIYAGWRCYDIGQIRKVSDRLI